ncbi:hypothetical protein DFH27DRAFT_118365 [Peziza echinospora]|nr:hypothetical protein DFH27DRAFT_118365 [Peziza echinospora]
MEKELGKETGGVAPHSHHDEFVRAPARPTRGYRVKRHCAGKWWMYLVGTVLFILVIVLIIIFAVIPKVAQNGFDKTTLTINSITILDPEPEKYQISVVSHIHGSSKLAHGKKIDAMKAKFYLDDSDPFMYLPFDQLKGSESIPVLKDNHTNEIPDAATFAKFAATLMGTEEFGMHIYGKTKIHLGSLAPKVKYRERVTLKGFNSLKGMQIVEYRAAVGEYSLLGKVNIPNPTVFTLQLGTIAIDIKLNGTTLGTGVIPDIIVSPGLDHTYDFKGNLSGLNVLNLGAAVRKGPVTLQVKATSVKYNGIDIPWLMGPLGAHDIDVPINVTIAA